MRLLNKIKKILFVIILIGNYSYIYSQNFGLGTSIIYNFQTQSLGASLRAEVPVRRLVLVPQIAYYPSFNKITEFYAGVSIHQDIVTYINSTAYLLLNGAYNGWINYETSSMEKAKFSNIAAEIGIGFKKGKCWKPFMELRYNFKWKEANLRIGIMYYFNCDKKGNRKKKKAVSCPAYNL